MDFYSVRGAERRRALARTLSRVADATVSEALAFEPVAPARPAWRVGFTGPPGSGKSSLISRLAAARLEQYPPSSEVGDERIAVLAVDPSSPLSGGALLGDRIRMDALADDSRAYVRSIASRGGSEGLAHNIADILAVTDAYGFDEVLLESVGVGQSECAIRALVDTLVLVLHPDAGDSIQAMKSGILELADVYVVNKADLRGAPTAAAELRAVIKVAASSAWMPPVIEVSRAQGAGFESLSGALERHRCHLARTRDTELVAAGRRRYHLRSLLQRRIDEMLAQSPGVSSIADVQARFAAGIALMSTLGTKAADNSPHSQRQHRRASSCARIWLVD
jgi:LAO/AO transport system kinase